MVEPDVDPRHFSPGVCLCFDAFYGPATLPLSRSYGSLQSGGRGAGVSQGMVASQATLWKPETAHQSVLSERSM